MRRKPGALLPLELDILSVVATSAAASDQWTHGYAIAKSLGEFRHATKLVAHGTLYKALARLADGGMVESQWEDPDLAVEQGRPRRRLYRITGIGRQALADEVVPDTIGAASASSRAAPV